MKSLSFRERERERENQRLIALYAGLFADSKTKLCEIRRGDIRSSSSRKRRTERLASVLRDLPISHQRPGNDSRFRREKNRNCAPSTGSFEEVTEE